MKKSLSLERLPIILYNIACYLDCLPLEAGLGPGATTWSGLLVQFDGLFRRLVLMLPSIEDITPLLRIMISILKVPGIQQSKVFRSVYSRNYMRFFFFWLHWSVKLNIFYFNFTKRTNNFRWFYVLNLNWALKHCMLHKNFERSKPFWSYSRRTVLFD